MNLEEQLKEYYQLARQIEELEEKKQALKSLIIEQVPEPKMQLGGFNVKRYSMLTIRTSVEDARVFSATKMEERIDRDKIKELVKQGQSIPGVSQAEYLQVSKPKEEAAPVVEKREDFDWIL